MVDITVNNCGKNVVSMVRISKNHSKNQETWGKRGGKVQNDQE